MRFGIILCFFVAVFAAFAGQTVIARPVIQVQAQVHPRVVDWSVVGVDGYFKRSVSTFCRIS